GVVAADLNGDGWIDFFVASDETPNQLYLGQPHLPFLECAQQAGVALGEIGAPVANMGTAIGDYNGDGRPDIFVTTFDHEDSSLYRNLGDGLFVYSTLTAGLAGISRMHVKFGTSLTDFDGDGWLDLFVLNGNPLYSTGESPHKQVPELFRNLAGRKFQDISQRGGSFFRQEQAGRGNAVGDLDDDGAPDIVTVQMNDPVRIQRNRLIPENYVRVELRARRGEPDATGARVISEFEGRQLVRFVVRGEGYFSQFDPRLIFPAGPGAKVADVIVDWPARGSERFSRLPVRRTHVLVEGRGMAIGP
ncbi:MAG TPA: CRTAC1 family protein, partial [Planctomycetaceae bacterium]